MKAIAMLCLISLACFLGTAASTPTVRCFHPKSVKQAVRQSAAVFSGEVLEIRTGRTYREARVRVDRSWKGVETQEVVVLVDSTVESPRYRVGEKYLVFAGKQYGELFTGNCSRTKEIKYAQGDLDQLGEGKIPKHIVPGSS